MTEARIRLTATERRAAVVETACRVFAKSSYRGSTTAEIARATGVTEPVLYRHFASKRELYLACLAAAWEQACVCSGARRSRTRRIRRCGWRRSARRTLEARAADRVILIDLWIQALSEAADDPEIRRGLREQVREVHAFVADVMRRSQEAGGVLPATATSTRRRGSSSRSACSRRSTAASSGLVGRRVRPDHRLTPQRG